MSISPLAKALGYAKFAGAAPRLMVMKSEYFLVEDVVAGARALGWAVHELPTSLAEKGSTDMIRDLLRAVVEFKPDFILTINHIGFDGEGKLTGLLDSYGIPLASWFVDHPLFILSGAEANARANVQVFSFERTVLDWLKEAGFEEPAYLPTASSARHFHPDRIQPDVAAKLGGALTWVVGSWWQKARESFADDVHAGALWLAGDHEIDRAFVTDVAPGLLGEARAGHRQQLGLMMQAALAEAAMNARADYAKGMAELGIVIHGDEHWAMIAPDADLRRPVHFERELPSLFAGSRVNLNVTAQQMPTALNQRVWDVPGAGGFLLTDAQEDVALHFDEGVDVVTFGDLDEARDKARFYLANDSARKKIAEKAFAKVDAMHRIEHRLLAMEQVMRARFS